MKICCHCKENKSLDWFDKSKNHKDGLRPTCRACRFLEYKKIKDADPASYKVRQNAATLKYRRANPEVRQNQLLRELFGITLEQYNKQAKIQNYVCFLCKKPETARSRGKIKRLSVDHCHITTINRGLLCQRCNVGIGMLGDDIKTLARAIIYIKNKGIWTA